MDSCLQACRPRSESFAKQMSPDGKKCCSELAPGTKQSEFWGPKTGSRFRHGFKCWATWRTHFWVRISTPKTGPQNAEKRSPPFVAARRNVAQSRAACAPTSHTATLARCLSTRYGRCRFMSCYSKPSMFLYGCALRKRPLVGAFAILHFEVQGFLQRTSAHFCFRLSCGRAEIQRRDAPPSIAQRLLPDTKVA